MTMGMAVRVAMMVIAAAQQPGAHDIHGKPEAGNRNSLAEMNGHRRKYPADRLVADQERNHRQDDRAGEAGEITQLSGSESEAGVVGVAARIGIGQRGEQQGAGVCAHVQAIGDQRNRSEKQPADDLRDHHGAAEPDHRPGLAFAGLVLLAQKDVTVKPRNTVVATHIRRHVHVPCRPHFT